MSGSRILVVEDELILAEDMARLLEESGHEVVGIASSGEEAIRLALEARPDLLLMDIKLKTQMDGIRAASLIRSEFDVPIIFLTAHSDQELFERAKTTGPAIYLSKPVLPVELTRNVEMVLSTHHLAKKVKESEERLRSILSSMDDCVFVLDESGIFVECHEGGSSCGIPLLCKEMAVGRHFSEVLPPYMTRLMENAFAAVTVEGQVQAFDYSVAIDDGELWFSAKVSMVRSHQGDFAGAAIVVRDITERKRAEKAIQDSEERYRLLVDMSPDGIAVYSGGEFLFANQAGARILGTTPEQIVGKPVLQFVHPDFRDAVKERMQHVLEERQSVPLHEAKVFRADGTVVDVEITEVPITYSGKTAGQLVARDVTDRKRTEEGLKASEERYRNVVEMLNEGLVITDERSCITYANPRLTSMLGYSKDELIGRSSLDFVDSAYREAATQEFGKRKQGMASSYESVLVGKGGNKTPVIISARTIGDEAEHSRGAMAVITDISDRRRFEDSLRQARDDLEIRVKQRTAELLTVNEQLREEVAARVQAELASRETAERLRAVVETATDSIFIKDKSLKYVFVNPAFSHLVGRPAESILGSSDGDLFGIEAEARTKELEHRVLAGEVVEEEHTRLVQGAAVTFLDIRAPMRDDLGNILGICGISRNITERKQTQSISALAPVEYPSLAMRSAMTAARLAAQTDSICLVTGESGSGKDRLVRYIHDRSKRSGGPFYSINCAAIPRELAESELFGYEAGAFTGANRRKRGLIELAEGGTLLLNEISELPLELQSKMLAFLDTMSITRVGGQKNFSVNVRLIAATNLDLQKEMAEGRFRRDLFYRLNVFTITVPPLRDRMEDIPLLVRAILSELVPQMGLSEVPQLDNVIIERLGQYAWPGNVRELRNVLERALILSQGRSLLGHDIVLEPSQSPTEFGTPVFRPETPLNQILGSLQRSLIEEALGQCGGNKKKAAEALGVSRYALARYMKKLEVPER